jgi:GNAT superfamily N-acetyltransferase
MAAAAGPGIAARPIRLLGAADIPDCLALAADRGWSREEARWSLLLDIGDGYGVDDPDGGLAGAVILTRYGGNLASVGMMLVAGRHGGQGLGRALMTHLLAQADYMTVFLHATDFGRPLYGKLGFRTVGTVTTMIGHFEAESAERLDHTRAGTGRDHTRAGTGRDHTRAGTGRDHTRPWTERDRGAIRRIDAEGFGGDREHVLRRLGTFAEQVRVLERDHEIAGYAAAWRNQNTVVIGPVIAPDDAAAHTLITELAAAVDGPVRLDPDPVHPDLTSWLLAHGLAKVNTMAFMVRGRWPPSGAHRHLYAPFTVAMG